MGLKNGIKEWEGREWDRGMGSKNGIKNWYQGMGSGNGTREWNQGMGSRNEVRETGNCERNEEPEDKKVRGVQGQAAGQRGMCVWLSGGYGE